MFFILSKVLWFLTAPSNVLAGLALLGILLCFTRHARAGRRIGLIGAVGLVIAGGLPTGQLMLRGLEDRFPQPDLAGRHIDGIVVLGGALDADISVKRGQMALEDAGERVVMGAILGMRYPKARLVFSGGSGTIISESAGSEADEVAKVWRMLGVPDAQITLESRSRNTHENAVFTKAIVQPKPGETWLLVTSAMHMPRSVGIFRQAGWPVVPYPVDFRTYGDAMDMKPGREISDGLRRFDAAWREYVGLVAYRLSGRSDALWPAP